MNIFYSYANVFFLKEAKTIQQYARMLRSFHTDHFTACRQLNFITSLFYSVDVTLDTNTAHPRLVLSEDLKTVSNLFNEYKHLTIINKSLFFVCV